MARKRSVKVHPRKPSAKRWIVGIPLVSSAETASMLSSNRESVLIKITVATDWHPGTWSWASCMGGIAAEHSHT